MASLPAKSSSRSRRRRTTASSTMARSRAGPFSAPGMTSSSAPVEPPARSTGGDGNDQLTGGAKADRFHGDSGKDLLIGAAGNDRLNGGFGLDTLTGGKGSDRFIFDNTMNADHVT